MKLLVAGIAAIGLLAPCAAAQECSVVRINEIRIDQPGADLDEYVELAGPAGLSLNGVTYLVIGDIDLATPPNQNGGIEAVVNLNGFSIGRDGLFLIGEPTLTLGTPDQAVSLNFEQTDNVTHMLVTGFTGTLNQDLDTNNDGVLDVTPWTSVLCSVSLINNATPNGLSSEYFYSSVVVGPDAGATPSHAWVCSDTLEWTIGQFDPAAATDTAGAENPECDTIPAQPLVLNEIRIDHPGEDTDEYVELAATPGTSLNGVFVVVLGDSPTGVNGSGVVDSVTDLTGNGVGASGFFLIAKDNDTFGAAADLVADFNFESSDTLSFFLVRDFAGAVGDDLDTNDDGTLDSEPWTEVIDSIALIENENPPVGTGNEWAYGPTVGPDGTFVPGHVYRCSPLGDWTIGVFDPVSGQDTPGAENVSCDFVQPCGSPVSGSCFEPKEIPNCSDAKCCETVCILDPSCCETGWDAECVDLAELNCLGCGDVLTGNCFEPHDSPFCDDAECCSEVCAVDASCCTADWDQACADLANALCVSGGTAPDVILNEIRIDQPGADNDEYFEIAGAAGTSLNGVQYIVIGDGAAGSGVIESIIDLTGLAVPADGIFLGVEPTFTLAPGAVDLTVAASALNLENTDTTTHLLVFNFTGSPSQDLDTNDDGVLDLTPWEEVIDSVAVLNSATTPPVNNDWPYSAVTVGPDGGAPFHVLRCLGSGAWEVGNPDPLVPDTTGDTPGAANVECDGGPVDPCGLPESGSCFVADATPGCDDATCCNLVCDSDPVCCEAAWDADCVALAESLCGTTKAPAVQINEIRIDQPDADDDEFFELIAEPSTSLDGVTYIVIGDGSGPQGSGVVERVISLTGMSTGLNGLFLMELAANQFENGDNVTHLLVFNFTGTSGQDLDTNDDGVLDTTPWDAIIDCVALLESAAIPPVDTEWTYCDVTVGPDGVNVPGHVYRCTPTGVWTIGSFELGVTDTPGAGNLPCEGDCTGDADGDGVNDCDDQCPGFDDAFDANGNGVPNGCDTCSADLDLNGEVDGADLGLLLGNWDFPGIGDIDSDGIVSGGDLGLLLGAWGSCPPPG